MTAAQEIVREVGISHCNNVRSLIDHVHAADSTHYIGMTSANPKQNPNTNPKTTPPPSTQTQYSFKQLAKNRLPGFEKFLPFNKKGLNFGKR